MEKRTTKRPAKAAPAVRAAAQEAAPRTPLALQPGAASAQEVQPWAQAAELPPGTIPIKTYKELANLVNKWATGELDDTLIVIGAAGVGKSETVRSALEGHDHCYLKGQATKYGVYLQLLQHIDQPIVLDDTDTLLASKEVTGLLKMLLETRAPRLVQWTTATTLLGDTVPASFATNSRTLVLANQLTQVSKNFAAVLDRSTIVWFAPSPEEIHEYAGTWFKDKEVYKYVGERLAACPSPSCRYYYHGQKWKAASLDWKAMLDTMMLPSQSKATLVRELEVKYNIPKDRVAEWKRVTGESEQSYWATKRAVDRLHGKGQTARGKAISEAMKRKHAARKAQEAGDGK